MKTFITILIIVAIAAGGWWFWSGGEEDENNSYSIGVIAPLSGGAANIGNPFANGMRMAVDEINASGGINGTRVALSVEDGEFSGIKSVSAAKKLLHTVDPDVFDVLFALPAQAVGPVFEQEKKPFLEWDYSRELVTSNAFAFKTGFDARTGCENFVRFAKTKGMYNSLGILMSRTPYNQSCYEGIKAVEAEVYEYWYEFGADDFRTLLSKAQSDGVDMLVTIPIDPEPIQIFKQLSDLSYPIKIMCFTSSECIYREVKEVVSDEALEGTVASDFVPADLFTSSFISKYRDEYPNESTQAAITWAAQGYDDVLIITEAFKNCRPKDNECMLESLNRVSGYNSPIGSDGFTNRIQNLTLRNQIYSNGEWVDL